MSIINYSATRRLLTMTRGHPYEREAFAGLLSGLDDFDVCHVEQPAAQHCLGPQAARDFDAILCYHMPGELARTALARFSLPPPGHAPCEQGRQ